MLSTGSCGRLKQAVTSQCHGVFAPLPAPQRSHVLGSTSTSRLALWTQCRVVGATLGARPDSVAVSPMTDSVWTAKLDQPLARRRAKQVHQPARSDVGQELPDAPGQPSPAAVQRGTVSPAMSTSAAAARAVRDAPLSAASPVSPSPQQRQQRGTASSAASPTTNQELPSGAAQGGRPAHLFTGHAYNQSSTSTGPSTSVIGAATRRTWNNALPSAGTSVASLAASVLPQARSVGSLRAARAAPTPASSDASDFLARAALAAERAAQSRAAAKAAAAEASRQLAARVQAARVIGDGAGGETAGGTIGRTSGGTAAGTIAMMVAVEESKLCEDASRELSGRLAAVSDPVAVRAVAAADAAVREQLVQQLAARVSAGVTQQGNAAASSLEEELDSGLHARVATVLSPDYRRHMAALAAEAEEQAKRDLAARVAAHTLGMRS